MDELSGALYSLARSLRLSRLHEFLLDQAQAKVDPAGMALLGVLFTSGASLRLTELAEHLRIEAPAVTRKVQQLERAGLVVRHPDQGDKRATRLELTQAGQQTIDRILAARRAWLTALVGDWPVADVAEFARLVRQFTSDIDVHLEGLGG